MFQTVVLTPDLVLRVNGMFFFILCTDLNKHNYLSLTFTFQIDVFCVRMLKLSLTKVSSNYLFKDGSNKNNIQYLYSAL